MDKTTVTFRIDSEKKAALDSIASSLNRNRSYVLNEAIDHYLDLYQSHVEHIRQGLRQAQAGKFVPKKEVEAFFNRVRRRRSSV